MAELIYNIRNVFSQNKQGCLVDYNCEYYHIASYQRGYKWGSDENGAVSILLEDLKTAFLKSKNNQRMSDYYLQYITLKKDEQTKYLEVIDGQQRLTTLSIFLSVFSTILDIPNIAHARLDYAVRSNFFKNYIYNKNELDKLLTMQWNHVNGLVFDEHTIINNQDTFYIFHALKKTNTFLLTFDRMELEEFYNYILHHVLIIVNVVEHVSSERVFSNLNSNKVPLTESELIKALFITRYGRLNQGIEKKTFREVQEQRLVLGRRWDEIENWVNDERVKSFYFNKNVDPMFGFLTLVAKSIENKKFEERTNHNELFNFFNDIDIVKIKEQLYHVYWILKDWLDDSIIYNRLGFIFFHRGAKKDISDYIDQFNYNSKQIFYNLLLEEIKQLLAIDIEGVDYAEDREAIHKILLAVNVFSSDKRFDFYKFLNEKWTLEHIFPQTPEGKNKKLSDQDKKYIIDLVNKEDKKRVKELLAEEKRDKNEKDEYKEALIKSGYIHSLGNLCLLSNVDNILNGCGFYEEKRTKIPKRIKNGGFVPSHTIEVFTKSIFEEQPGDFTRWTKENIESHRLVLGERLEELLKELSK